MNVSKVTLKIGFPFSFKIAPRAFERWSYSAILPQVSFQATFGFVTTTAFEAFEFLGWLHFRAYDDERRKHFNIGIYYFMRYSSQLLICYIPAPNVANSEGSTPWTPFYL